MAARELAHRAEISEAMLYRIEAGEIASTNAASRVAKALGMRVEPHLVDPRKKALVAAPNRVVQVALSGSARRVRNMVERDRTARRQDVDANRA